MLLVITACSNSRYAMQKQEYIKLIKLGDIATQTGNPQRAAILYKGAYNLYPSSCYAIVKLADSYYASEDYKNAAIFYEKAIRIDPTSSKLRLQYSNALMQLGAYNNAFTTLSGALATKQKDLIVLNQLAILLDLNRLHNHAQRCYRYGLKNNPRNVMLRSNYITSLLLTRQYHNALRQLSKLPHMSTNNKYTYKLLRANNFRSKKFINQINATLPKLNDHIDPNLQKNMRIKASQFCHN
jgi:tetratricopeptide (TPR) repeat protein